MHEMSIAEGVLEIAESYRVKEGAGRIVEVSLLLGEMAGVETESLSFCWEALTKGTAAEGAALIYHRVPLLGRCSGCGREEKIVGYRFLCSECGGTMLTISGRELQVESLELD